jgi:hypothetical protein
VLYLPGALSQQLPDLSRPTWIADAAAWLVGVVVSDDVAMVEDRTPFREAFVVE